MFRAASGLASARTFNILAARPSIPHLYHRRKLHTTTVMSDKPNAPPTAYPADELKQQDQEGGPGLDAKLEPAAVWTQLEYWTDDGKPYLKEYEGRGLLQDKAVLITGGDSGIGRSVSVLMAREGADISFVYLPEEEEDAQATKKMIEQAGRTAHLLPLDLLKDGNCKKAVEGHMEKFGKLNVLVNNSISPPPSASSVTTTCRY